MKRSLGFSGLIHIVILIVLAFYKTSEKLPEPKIAPIVIELTPKTKIADRIVQTEKTKSSKKPAKRAFLGKQTQTVDRETVGKEFSPKVALGVKGSQAQRKKNLGMQEQPSRPLAKLGLPVSLKAGKNPNQIQNWGAQGMVPQDFVKGINEGEKTLLNTKEFVYYGYFQRIREQLSYAWHPILKRNLRKFFDKGRKLASEKDHITRLIVTLSSEGSVTQVQLLEDSGIVDLDDAAVEAFNRAGPFPNPPKGIADSDGQIKIRWDFNVKT